MRWRKSGVARGTLIRLTVAPGLALALSACASKPPEAVVDFAPDYNFGQTKTIGFYAMSGEVTGNNPAELADLDRDHIDSALRSALEGNGFEFVTKTTDADLLLSSHLNLMEKTNVKTHKNPSYGASMGYRRYNQYAMHRCYDCMNHRDIHVIEYTQGTFIIDMIDPVQNASVWPSVVQSKPKRRDHPQPDCAGRRHDARADGFPFRGRADNTLLW